MSASDYPVTFGYGATDGTYYGPNGSVGPYHRGDDRAMPIGTPVIVNGVQLGLSGAMYGGPHLHIGRFVNGRDTNPNGGGFSLKAPVIVTDVKEDSTNGKFVALRDGDGVRWVYLHLSRQDVTVGQELKGDNEVPLNRGDIINVWPALTGHAPSQADFDAWVDGKKTAKDLLYDKVLPELRDHNIVNRGDVVNYLTPLLGHPPTDADIAAWSGGLQKAMIYNKLIPEIKNRIKG